MQEFIIKILVDAAIWITVKVPIAVVLIKAIAASGSFEMVGWPRPTWGQAVLIAIIVTIAVPMTSR